MKTKQHATGLCDAATAVACMVHTYVRTAKTRSCRRAWYIHTGWSDCRRARSKSRQHSCLVVVLFVVPRVFSPFSLFCSVLQSVRCCPAPLCFVFFPSSTVRCALSSLFSLGEATRRRMLFSGLESRGKCGNGRYHIVRRCLWARVGVCGGGLVRVVVNDPNTGGRGLVRPGGGSSAGMGVLSDVRQRVGEGG